jgi:hypothetical protein
MPEKKAQDAQTKRGTWWVPVLIGVLLLMVPGGAYASPVMFLLAVIMKARKPKEKSPQNSPHSPLPLINITP